MERCVEVSISFIDPYNSTPEERLKSLVDMWNNLEFRVASPSLWRDMEEIIRTKNDMLKMYPQLKGLRFAVKSYNYGPIF